MRENKIKTAELKKDILDVYVFLNRIPTRNEYNKYGKHAANTYLIRYKGWKKVIQTFFSKQEIEQDPRYNKLFIIDFANKKNMINDLKKIYKDTNKIPNRDEYSKLSKFPLWTVYRVFGSFSNLLIESNICKDKADVNHKLRGNKSKHTKAQIINEYKALAKKLNKTPSAKDIKFLSYGLTAIRNKFGTFENLQKICGFKVNTNYKIDNQKLLDELIRIKNKINKPPKTQDIEAYSKYSINAYKRAFGGLSQALLLIGEKPNIKFDCSNYDINSEIMSVYKKVNRAPTIEDINKHSNISYGAIRRINDKSWHIILEEAGVPTEAISAMNKRNVTNEQLKEEIVRLKNKLGRYPNYYDVVREAKFSCNTYESRFGSFIKAMHALGFTDYINQSIYQNQIHTLGLDGQMYKSFFEAEIANCLYNLGKNYEYEKLVCPEKTWTCDFYVDGKWIEADGMGNNRKNPYNKNNEKIKYYIDNGFDYHVLKYRRNIGKQLEKIFKAD